MPSELSDRHVPTQARNCAGVVADVLAQSLLKHQSADRALASVLRAHHEFGSRDRRVISETLFAVLRWWGWLKELAPADFVAAWQSRDEYAKLSLSLQSFYPAFAAAWFLEGKNEFPAAVDFWLESVGIYRDDIKFLPKESPVLERKRYLKAFCPRDESYSFEDKALLPDWMEGELADPQMYRDVLEWSQHRPPVWIRVAPDAFERVYNEFKEHGIRAAMHPNMNTAWQIDYAAGTNLRLLQSFKNGLFEIQDAASQTIAQVCAPKAGEQWWDACAGGGGKTLHLATLMERRGSVLATDIRTYKLEELKLRARRAQFPNIRTREWKGKDIPTLKAHFDGVLVDTACSCSGTWRRNPDARWTTFPEEIPEFHALQLQLLTNASRGVKQGGTLVYATCSMFNAENQAVVEDFLSANSEFTLQPFQCPLTMRQTNGTHQLWFWDGDCDAMFVAKMKRKSDSER